MTSDVDQASKLGLQVMTPVDGDHKNMQHWAAENRDEIEQCLQSNGALLVRGLKVNSSRQFGKLLNTLFDAPLLPYNHRSSPRTELKGNVYTATEYHSDQVIVQHNEQAYTNVWPMRIGFCSLLPAQMGGETPLADSRVIYNSIPESIRDEFERKGLLYVRNFADIDLPWQEVFNTEDKAEVECYCLANDIQFEWLENNNLRTKQRLDAVTNHPLTGEPLWFNQAHLFHVSSLEQAVKEQLLSSLGVENAPRNVYFGDGSEIPEQSLKIISDIYEQYKFSFKWKKGDVLLLDNMLYSHGRMPFSGERQTLVGMAQPYLIA